MSAVVITPIEPTDHVVITSFTFGGTADTHYDAECMWYAGCHREAMHWADHPVLGKVQTCTSCVTRLRGLAAQS